MQARPVLLFGRNVFRVKTDGHGQRPERTGHNGSYRQRSNRQNEITGQKNRHGLTQCRYWYRAVPDPSFLVRRAGLLPRPTGNIPLPPPGRDGRNWMRKQSGMLSGRLSGRRQSSTARKLKPFAYPACPINIVPVRRDGTAIRVTESFRKTTGRQK